MDELLAFLDMVKQKDKKNYDLAFICGIKVRRFQQLKQEFKETGEVHILKKNRRPRTPLTEEEKGIIDKALDESKLCGAVTLRLFFWVIKFQSRMKRNKNRENIADIGESKAVPGKQVIVWEDDASRNILAGDEFDNATTNNAIKVVKEAKKIEY